MSQHPYYGGNGGLPPHGGGVDPYAAYQQQQQQQQQQQHHHQQQQQMYQQSQGNTFLTLLDVSIYIVRFKSIFFDLKNTIFFFIPLQVELS